jgi:putative radical SAM enzyme (TIGR03279 family)
MPLFHEIDPLTFAGGRIVGIEPGSVAAALDLRPGDELLAINDRAVEDIIDVQFYSAEEELELLIRRDGELILFEAEREYYQSLGLEFAHPTFDVDIRRCNNLCEFCFVLQMGPKFRRTLYIKDDDYRYSFLFGHYVTLTNLSDHDWWRIETMRLSPLYVSVHVTDTEMRRRFLRNATAGDIMAQLRWLAERHIDMHAQLVIVPGFNDGEWLRRSVNDLATLWPGDGPGGGVLSVSVVPVGLTRFHKYGMRPHTPAEAAATLDYVEALQPEFITRFGVRFLYPTDEWYLVTGRDVPPLDAYDGHALHENGLGMVRAFLDDWAAVREEIAAAPEKPAPRAITLATAALFAPTLRRAAGEFAALTGCAVTVQPIRNERLGETITVAGLLNGSDVLTQLAATDLGELVVLPRVMFDHPDRVSLDNLSPQDIANQLDRPVALADSLGDVWDALQGQSRLLFMPGVAPASSIDLRVLGDGANGSGAHIS